MSEPPAQQWPDQGAAGAGSRFPPPAPGTGAGAGADHQNYRPQQQFPVGAPQPAPWPQSQQQHGWTAQTSGYAAMPSPNWGLSITALIVSFYLGVGIVAFVYSNQVQAKFLAGDIEGSRAASNNARIWGIVGCAVGGLVLLIASVNAGY